MGASRVLRQKGRGEDNPMNEVRNALLKV